MIKAKPLLYFFDMDHTLIDNDCDLSWKVFLNELKIISAADVDLAMKFFDDYRLGILDEAEFIKFQFQEFIGQTADEMLNLAESHFENCVKDKFISSSVRELCSAQQSGVPVALLTGTNQIVAAPIARHCNIEHVLATGLESDNEGRFTGRVTGEYCCGTGKIAYAEEFCRRFGLSLKDVAYYGDSLSDRFLLEKVGFPVAVNPCERLLELAVANNWRIMTAR